MDASWPCLSPCTEIGIKMRRLIIRRMAYLHFKYIATTQKVAGSTRLAVLILRFSPICPPRSANDLALTQRSPLTRLSVPAAERSVCALLGVKRTSVGHSEMSAFDPKLTSRAGPGLFQKRGSRLNY